MPLVGNGQQTAKCMKYEVCDKEGDFRARFHMERKISLGTTNSKVDPTSR